MTETTKDRYLLLQITDGVTMGVATDFVGTLFLNLRDSKQKLRIDVDAPNGRQVVTYLDVPVTGDRDTE